MSDLTPRQSNRPSRRRREQRAYTLTLATGAAALVTAASLVLAILGITSLGLVLLFLVITVVLGWTLKRTLSP